jgi:cell division protein FtsB
MRSSRRADPWYLRVRWDRVGRLALLVTLGGVLLLYVGPARSYLSTWREAGRHRGNIDRLERENRALRAERRSLHDPHTLERRARALGMVRSDERSYVVMGLPKDR